MSAFVTLAEIERALLHDKPRRRFIIPDVLPAGPAILFGSSGSGKTGIAIRTAAAIAAGLDWANRPVTSGAVLYIAGEDLDGAKERMVAAARAVGREPSDLPIAIMEVPEGGMTASGAKIAVCAQAKALAKQAGIPVALIIVDTLAAAFGPKSQDDATAAGEYMNTADRIARDLQCCVLSVHHTGKDESAGMRGSRVLFDRSDAVIRVKQGESASFVTVEKMRNGRNDARFAFEIEGSEIDTSGGRISVQVTRNLRALEDATGLVEGKDRRKPTIAEEMIAVLSTIIRNGAAPLEAWKVACYQRWNDKNPASHRKVFSKNLKQLETSNLVRLEGETVTLVTHGDTEVTNKVTRLPERPSPSPSPTPSLEGGDVDTGTGRLRGDGAESSRFETEIGETNGRSSDLPRRAGRESPAIDYTAAGDGDARTGTGG